MSKFRRAAFPALLAVSVVSPYKQCLPLETVLNKPVWGSRCGHRWQRQMLLCFLSFSLFFFLKITLLLFFCAIIHNDSLPLKWR